MFFGKLKNSNDYGFGCFEDRFESYKDIDDDYHMALVEKANQEGKAIGADEEGNPILVDLPPLDEKIEKSIELTDLKKFLKETDWYVLRFIETNKPIPDEIKTQRQKARDRISEIKNILKSN